jgi:carbonic anhydrase
VVRVAGNVLDPAIAGSLQYAGVHLHTPLLVVLGHEGCGAVQAAIAEKYHGAQHHSRIAMLVDIIEPALENLDPTQPPADLLEAAVEANVRRTVEMVVGSPEWQTRGAKVGARAVGAIYSLSSGSVRFLE